MEIGPLDVHTLVDRAYQKIEAAIMTGRLPAGTRIREGTLAKSLGISRGPLREAIRLLEGRKLLKRIPHVGVSVIGLSPEDLLEIFEVREALEGMACRLAAANMTDAELSEVEDLLQRHSDDEQLQAGAAYYQEAGDFDFHYRVASGSKNSRLIGLLCGDLYYLLRVYRYQSGSSAGRAWQAFEEHRRILAAIRARDPDAAEALMRKHIKRSRVTLQELWRSTASAPTEGGEDRLHRLFPPAQ